MDSEEEEESGGSSQQVEEPKQKQEQQERRAESLELGPSIPKQCPNCGKEGTFIFDSGSGELVCTNCGYVLRENIVDTRPEWRTFAGDDEGKSSREERAHRPTLHATTWVFPQLLAPKTGMLLEDHFLIPRLGRALRDYAHGTKELKFTLLRIGT